MNLDRRRSFCLASVALAMTACASSYVPKVRDVDPASIPTFPPRSSVALINNQPAKQAVQVGPLIKASYNAWTGSLIASMKRALQSKGVQVADTSQKSLKIGVTSVNVAASGGGFAANCTVSATVEAAGGIRVEVMRQKMAAKYHGCDAVIADLTQAILNDESIKKALAGI